MAEPRPIDAVVIEPSDADRFWLRMVLAETGIPHSLREFSSSVAALAALAAPEKLPADFVFISVKPPLLDVGEAIPRLSELPCLSAARFAVMIVDTSECGRVPEGCETLLKPVGTEEMRKMLLPRWKEIAASSR